MSLKQIINEQKILETTGGFDYPVELDEEPLIYSIKYPVGKRYFCKNTFRDRKWRSYIKCCLRSYSKTHVPVVFLVRFYVSPPANVNVSKEQLRAEKTPAVFSYELCDYLLSFLEMCREALFNSYRQIARFEVDKFYSAKPRTVFKFMKWDHYVKLYKDHNTDFTKAKVLSKDKPLGVNVQSECKGNEASRGLRQEPTARQDIATVLRSMSSDSTLQDSGT